MDIRLKNNKLKLGCFILALYMLGLAVLSLNSLKNDKQFLKTDPYFKSEAFANQINDFLNLFVSYNIDNNTYSSKTAEEKIDKEELKNLKTEYDNMVSSKLQDIENEYNPQITDAENNGNKDKLTRLTEERNRKLEEVKKQNNKTEEDFKKELVEKSDANYNNLKKQFESRNDVRYYLKDNSSGDVYTNLKNVDNLENYIKSNALYYISLPQKSSQDELVYKIDHRFMDLGLEGYIIVPYGGTHLSLYKDYNQGRTRAVLELFILVFSLVGGILLLRLSRKNNIDEHGLIVSSKFLYNRIPFDLKLIAFAISLLFIPVFFEDGFLFWSNQIPTGILFTLTLKVLLIFYFYVALPELIDILKGKKQIKQLLQSGIINKFRDIASKSFKEKTILYKSIIALAALLILSFVTAVIFGGHGEPIVLFIFLYIAAFIAYVMLEVITLDKIIKGTNEIVSGNLNYAIKESGKGNLSKLAHNINNMKSGISRAVENQMKSDRLKSELITNVSHDLKTPLTSIINYVDLLKREDLTKEEMKDYISVLDRKTQRLKVLIEDLFEASKMASGAVELNIEKVDVAQLLTQALAEFDEKIKTSSLAFRVNIPHQKVYANLDGKKTWRVFENLVGNILKYSQPCTRVYIELIDNEDSIIITMKNISAYEMDFNVDEIFERFKRGDASRATEGSGLGLAISKSIVDLQGGSLNIEIDGDLFKAIVEFKK